MKPQLSLRNDPRVTATLRRDLARYADDAPDYDVERGLERLSAALAIGVAGSSAPAAVPGLKALGAKVLSLSSIKVVAVCLVVGGAGGAAAMHAFHRAHVASAPALVARPHAAPAAPSVERAAPVEGALQAQEAPPPVEAPSAFAAPSPAVVRHDVALSPAPRREHRHEASTAPPPPVATAPDDAALREEIAALGRLREVAERDPAGAVALSEAYDARHPGGRSLFAEEREAITILALAAAGRADEARERGTSFLALHPKSPYAARVQALTTR